MIARLASLAGLTDAPSVESLERRELLFTVTVTADSVDPNTGIGTATAFFGYALPHLIKVGDPTQTQDQIVTENFDQQAPGALGSNQQFANSPVRRLHGIFPPSDFQIEPLNNANGTNDRWIKASMDQPGEFFAFELDQAAGSLLTQQAKRVTFDIRPNNQPGGAQTDVTGLLPDLYIVELVSNRVVTASFTGNALRAAIAPNGNTALGTGTFAFNAPANFPGFDTVRVRALVPITGRPDFQIDNLAFTVPAGQFANTIKTFGAQVTIAGPVGASATFFDLYGRDMVQTISVDKVPQGQVLFIDADDNGIPNFNDGIGRIVVNGSDLRTAITLWGGELQQATGTRPDNVDAWDGTYSFTKSGQLKGLFDAFETAGFGYVLRTQQTTATVAGLPDGPGSVIIGSPFVRPLNNYNPGGNAPGTANPVTTGFTRSDQGIFVNGDIGSIMIHGLVHGSSEIHGAADRVNIGYMVGSLSVDGDLGTFASGTDAGMWAPDPGFVPPPNVRLDAVNKTNGHLVVGRTVGEILIGGRMEMDVTVIGDINSPQTRPTRDSFNYWEKEFNFGTGTTGITELDIIRRNVNNTSFVTRNSTDLFRGTDQGYLFGDSNFLRNDTIMGAEWVGSNTGGVHIRGDLSGVDPINGEDRSDVYAFASDGTSEIVIEAANTLTNISPYFRLMDQDGRTLAAPELPIVSGRFTATQLRYKPTGPGVYYVVISDPNGNDTGTGTSGYSMVITGMAVTTLGAIRTAGGFGFTDINSGEGNTISVLSGNVGSIRVGMGHVDGTGQDASPLETYNTVQDDDDSLSFQGGTFSIAGSLYNITAGSDFGAPHTQGAPPDVVFQIGGDFGTLFTGLNGVVGTGPGEGDLNFLNMSVGGKIALLDIRGGIGMDQDAPDPRGSRGNGIVNIRTGTAGRNGDIGMIRTGFHIYGDSASIVTSPGSTIGAFLTSQDSYGDANARSGIYLGQRGIPITTGFGSDIRFVDAIRLDLSNSTNVVLPIIGDRPLNIVDDSGAAFTITVEGAPPDVQIGAVIALPIDGSQGVAVGQIRVDLSGGRILRITPTSGGGGGNGPALGVVGIGRINVVGSDAASAIEITGGLEIDVMRIDAPGGLDHISNQTPGGDILLADVASLNTIDIKGDLGRTQLPSWGPMNYAPFLGVDNALGGDVGAPVGSTRALFDNDYNGNIFRPTNDDNFDAGRAYMDDIGGPFDGWINGLVVRNGNLISARVGGGLGDLILQDATSTLNLLDVNQDAITQLGRFDGIFGTVFARDLGRINTGDGVVNSQPSSPLAAAGIFAEDDILEIISTNTSGTRYSAPIIAGNIRALDVPGGTQDGIAAFRAVNATIDGLFLGSQNLDGFWVSFNYTEDNLQTGDLSELTLTGTNIFRSQVRARDIRTVTIAGYWDASQMAATGNIGTVTATGYRNSTLAGDGVELRQNRIEGARDLDSLTATQDMQDLAIDITGRVRRTITARNIERTSIDVDNELAALAVTNDIRGSAITVGALPTVTVGRNLSSSSLTVSGNLTTLTVAGAIQNGDIEVSGADGGIGTITALKGISGSISAAGPIGTIAVTAGDLTAHILTSTARGNVTALTASGDVAITADISGNLGTITAGRNIGGITTRGAIVVRGDLTAAAAPAGQLYADLRVAGSILGAVTLGGAIAKPEKNLVGQGSIIAFKGIGTVSIAGDFDGDIISYGGGIASVAITNGSLLPGNIIAAYEGSLTSVVITNGSLFGSVHADINITSLRIVADSAGVFGDIGINPASSALTSFDAKRNQLPVGVAPGTAIQGPTISAGQNIVSVVVTNGSVFETAFVAGRAIQTVTINGGASNDAFTSGTSTFFAAGDSIDNVSLSGSVTDAMFIAGVLSLGNDNRPGGTGVNADALKAGNITKVTVSGTTTRTMFVAGVGAGQDGLYNTADDRQVLGRSTIATLSLGSVGQSVVALGDILSSSVAGDNRLVRGGTSLTNLNPDLDSGVGTPGTSFSGTQSFSYSGATVTIATSGGGQFFFNTTTGRLTARNTTSASNITVSSSTGTIANFDLTTNDDASLGNVTFQAALTGDSDVTIDGTAGTLTFAAFSGTGTVAVGGAATGMTFASFTGGFVAADAVGTFRVTGDYGASNALTTGEVNIQLLSAGAISFGGAMRGTLSVDRSATSLILTGLVERASMRIGGSLATFSAPSLSRTLVTVGDNLGTVTVGGEVFASTIAAGLDLGRDAAFDANGLDQGADGLNADVLSTGTIGPVLVAGNLRESNVVAGYYRNKDGFFGSSDDNVASGRSSIGAVTIGGTQVGSTRASESYRIASTGTVGIVTIGGALFSGTTGNFALETPLFAPAPVQVADLRTFSDAGVFYAELQFNQAIDASTLSRSLSVSEVRGNGNVEIRLIEGPDYTVVYRPSDTTAVVTFSRSLTSQSLPVVPGRPGPGVYRFALNSTLLRPKLNGQALDGNADGVGAATGDSYSQDSIVGDAGDKLTNGTATAGSTTVDFYAPANLNFVLDDNAHADGLPDINKTVTIRGSIGDHADHSTNFFSFASDMDLYSITLQAGQIVHIGALQGPGSRAGFSLLTGAGAAINATTNNALAISLPSNPGSARDFTFDQSYLIKTTGTYIFAVGSTASAANVANTATVPNIPTPPGGVGAYSFTLEVFDDGDSGFTSTTNAGDGTAVVNAPSPIAFAGNDQVFGTADDLTEIDTGNFTFTYNKGADNTPNTLDDLVTGTDSAGITSTRNGAGQLVSSIRSAIGTPGHAGVPFAIGSDVDVYHLNNRLPIAPGTPMRITVKLTDIGANLGSATAPSRDRNATRNIVDNRGFVQFGLFDTSASANVEDAQMVFSPTEFRAFGGNTPGVIAQDGATKYGYDANGDFFIEFVTPDRQGVPGASGTFAVYLQGATNSDYTLEVVTNPGTVTPTAPARQNFYIETGGGSVNWLQVGGATTKLAAFDPRSMGFSGSAANGTPVGQYLISSMLAQLNSLYQGAGFDVRFSNNPVDFEGEQFSTIYLSSTNDPIIPIFDPFNLFNFAALSGGNTFATTQPFGFSQRSDPFNVNKEDEAVVFVPSFALQGYTPSLADLDRFSKAVTAAVGRRAGELMGLRITEAYANTGPFDALAANSPQTIPGTGLSYSLSNTSRGLSDSFDATQNTDFFLGRLNSVSLLRKFVSLR